jgi:hypothetical protein
MSAPNVNFLTAKVNKRRVWFNSSAAPTKGEAVCYQRDFTSTAGGETAADPCQKRDARVEPPDNTNNLAFAGVILDSKPAKTGGQWVDIAMPGSVCKIRTTGATTLGYNDVVTAIAGGDDAGKFGAAGFMGRGTARVFQTDADGGLVLAKLYDGDESGLVETVTPAAAGGATTIMVGGVTVLDGTVTLAANATATLADGVYEGMKKGVKCTGTYTTNDFVLTVTSGLQEDRSTALASLSFDADAENAILTWYGEAWTLENKTTATKA